MHANYKFKFLLNMCLLFLSIFVLGGYNTQQGIKEHITGHGK